MDRTLKLAGAGMNQNFVEDSPQQARPVASSTFMASKTEFDFKDFDNTFQSPKTTSVASVSSTTSSLGVLDLEKQSLLSDLETSRNLSRNFVQEQVSLSLKRFKERLSSIGAKTSFEKEHSNEKKSQLLDMTEPEIGSDNLTKNDNSTKTLTPNSIKSPALEFSVYDISSHAASLMSDAGSFESGKHALLRLEADQKENREKFGSLPVSPINISWNSENVEEREKQFSRVVHAKCYSPEEISNVLRNKLSLEQKEHMTNDLKNKQRISDINSSLPKTNASTASDIKTSTSVVPAISTSETKIESTKNGQCSLLSNRTVPTLPPMEYKFNDSLHGDIKVAIPDSTSFNDTLEESCASSVASIHQITETLRRKSFLSEPRRMIEHLLSSGKTKPKYLPSLASVLDVKSDEDTSDASVLTEHNSTPTSLKYTSVETPSTITCPAREFQVDSVTKKVFANDKTYPTTFITARQLLESKEKKSFTVENTSSEVSFKDPAKYFHLCNASSPLEVVVQSNRVPELWKLNPINSVETVKFKDELNISLNSTSELLEKYRKRIEKLTSNPNSNFGAISKNRSIVKGFTEPVRRISLSHNVSNAFDSTCIGTFDSEIIEAGILCVGTQVEVTIAIENPTDIPIKYKTVLKSILANKAQHFSAASVMLVSDESDVTLLPNIENEIKIMLSPLVEGEIEVTLEFESEQTQFSNLLRRIKVAGELPKLQLIEPDMAVMNFGMIVEDDSKMLPLRLKNEGLARLPLKLIIQEDNGSRISSARMVIEPLDTFSCCVRIISSEILKGSSDVFSIEGELAIVLDTSEEGTLSSIIHLRTIKLETRFSTISLFLDENLPIIMRCNSVSKSACNQMRVKNTSATTVNVSVNIIGTQKMEFHVEPKSFELPSNREQLIKICFNPTFKIRQREIDIRFVVNGSKKIFSRKVIGFFEGDATMASSSTTTTPMKRANVACNSPNANSHSSSSSSTGAEGPMELDCTHNSISWGSVALHSKNVQTITLRNRNCQKEKLLLSISDSNGTFKFIDNEFCYRELKLTLEPQESRKISIMFMPFVADQAINGRILIMRQHSLESSISELRKRVIPLYGIGGRVKITYSGVFRDNENRLWITPDSDTFEAKFTAENTGNSVAFVKIVTEDPDDGLLPDELILLPRESAEINYNLKLSKDRLDLICKQNPQKEVLLANKLMVFSGCESTRLRLKKLWTKYREFDNIQRIRDKIESLVDMNIRGQVQVDTLADIESTLSKLWYEDVTEETIGILISQQHLDSICLDSTVVFKDLAESTNAFEIIN